MAVIYVRSTDGADADNGSTWALAKATLAGADAIDATGDSIYVSQSHSESTAAAVTLSFAGTAASPTMLICGNDGAAPPTAVASTAIVATSGGNALTINGSLYAYGITFQCSVTGAAGNLALAATAGTVEIQKYKNCVFDLRSSSTSQRITISNSSPTVNHSVSWENCNVRFATSGHGISLGQADFRWAGGAFVAGTSTTTNIFSYSSSGRANTTTTIECVDFSNLGTAFNVVGSDANDMGKLVLRNCKFPASWAGNLITTPAVGLRVEMYNCDSLNTNYTLWIEDYSGTIKHETTIAKSYGASDGVTAMSWKMTSNASANLILPLVSGEIFRSFPGTDYEVSQWTSGASKTITIDIVTDSVTALKDDEVWIEVQYFGTSGSTLGTIATDYKTNVLTTAANQEASTATWNTTGLTNPNKQKLVATITPYQRGYISARVVLAKPSTTIYVDPKIMVS